MKIRGKAALKNLNTAHLESLFGLGKTWLVAQWFTPTMDTEVRHINAEVSEGTVKLGNRVQPMADPVGVDYCGNASSVKYNVLCSKITSQWNLNMLRKAVGRSYITSGGDNVFMVSGAFHLLSTDHHLQEAVRY